MPDKLRLALARLRAYLHKVLRGHDEFFIADPDCALPACRIRPVTEADYAACEEIYRLNEAAHFPPDVFEHFLAYLHSGRAYFLVAEVDGKVRAFGGVSIHAHAGADVAGLGFGMVHPEFRKQGYGTALLLARVATLPPPRKLWLLLITTTGGSETFYGRFGFTFSCRLANPKAGVKLDHYYVKVPPVLQRKCRQLLERASIKLESRSTDVPVVAHNDDEALAQTPRHANLGAPVYDGELIRAVGAGIGSIGLGLAALLFWGGRGLAARAVGFDPVAWVVFAVMCGLTVFCLNAGWRMLLLRPNQNGSLMGPGGWYALSAFFALLGLATGITSVINGHPDGLVVVPLVGLLCAGCIRAARLAGRGKQRRRALVAPANASGPDTANTGHPAGTQASPPSPDADAKPAAHIADSAGMIEIFNDDATPMEFVITALADFLRLERSEAIKLMLQIHRTGSVLVPCDSEAEAARIAALICTRAREQGHPLLCQVAVPEA